MITEANSSRLASVSDGTRSAEYGYLTDSPLVEAITFKQSGTNKMVTAKAYDKLNRLKSTTHQTNSVTMSSYGYDYNQANQRVKVTEADGSYWIYLYDALGQVKSGKKYWSDGKIVAGQQFEYGFDDIGNRKTAASGGDQWGVNLQYENYTVNSLNQYSQRTVPGVKDVIGTALTNATVTVNNQATYRKGEYFWKALGLDNSASAVWQSVTNVAVLNQTTNDLMTNVTGNVFLPKTPEVFSHDVDGNLTNDGRWILT